MLFRKFRNRRSYYHLQLGRLDFRLATAIGCDINVAKLDWLSSPKTVQRSTDGNAPQPTSPVLYICKLPTVPCIGKHFLNDVLRIMLISEDPPGALIDQRSIGIDKCCPFDRQRNSSQGHFHLTTTICHFTKGNVSQIVCLFPNIEQCPTDCLTRRSGES